MTAMGKASEGARVRVRMGHCWHAVVPRRICPKDVKVVPDTTVLQVPDIKVLDMPSFLMPKLDMPKTDVPSPPKIQRPCVSPSQTRSVVVIVGSRVQDPRRSPQV